MLSQRAPRALALAILLSCALLARAADEGTALDRELYDVCRQKTPLVPLADVEALLEKGANASFIGEYDYTPLMWACVRHRPDLSAVLLAAGANTETTNVWGRNAAFIAIWENQSEIIAQFLERGMNISAAAEHDGWTALHKAAEMDHAAIVRMLLAKGADPLARTLPNEEDGDDEVRRRRRPPTPPLPPRAPAPARAPDARSCRVDPRRARRRWRWRSRRRCASCCARRWRRPSCRRFTILLRRPRSRRPRRRRAARTSR